MRVLEMRQLILLTKVDALEGLGSCVRVDLNGFLKGGQAGKIESSAEEESD
jgi:hypothetical protein